MAVVLQSPLRFVTSALAISAGFAFVLEVEDQFHRAAWYGLLFAAITGLWFIIGSFLTVIDTLAVWVVTAFLVLGTTILWIIGRYLPRRVSVDDTGGLDEPLTVIRLSLMVLVLVTSAMTVAAFYPERTPLDPLALRRWAGSGRGVVAAGVVTLVVALTATVLAALAQSYASGEKASPPAVSDGTRDSDPSETGLRSHPPTSGATAP